MLKVNLYIYIVCVFLNYKLLDQCLLVVDKNTNQNIADTKKGRNFLIFAKLFYSITWIISLPYIYFRLKKEGK